MNLDFTMKVIDSPTEFRHNLLAAIRLHLNKALIRALPGIRKEAKQRMGRVFRSSPVYNALNGGDLQALLGLRPGESTARVESIIDAIVNNMQFTFKPLQVKAGRIYGGLEIGLLVADFSDILSLPAAIYTTTTGKIIPWLEWLLIRGDQIIILGHNIEFGNFDESRSGQAVMVESQNIGWRVPPQYSGTINDNWLTRSIDRAIKLIESQLTIIVSKHIGIALNVIS